ncbi:MAG: glycosyltransferase family 2 protein [Thaumarchaeota archaeon]|jgi:glycosyltransferase involved in cell wall biosynthesis|nr:MAG: glycosyltransferase family 2 protein [Nitrososphaerota archaeon]
MNSNEKLPKVCIGMPVYNGEKFLRSSLDCILNQSYENIEIIISDDASVDSTKMICAEYVKKDSRIKYIQQTKNLGGLLNFNFVLSQAKSKYFMWAEVDDKWEPGFIQKNVAVLESNSNIVGSISEVSWYGKKIIRGKGSILKNLLKFRKPYDIFAEYEHVLPTSGTFEKKVGLYLRFNRGTNIFAVYRTEKLKKSIVEKPIAGWDLTVILKVLRFGDINVLKESLMQRYAGGISSGSILFTQRRGDKTGWLASLFVYMPLTIWCLKNLGLKIFLKNLDWFFVLNGYGGSMVLPEIPMLLRYVFLKQEPKK